MTISTPTLLTSQRIHAVIARIYPAAVLSPSEFSEADDTVSVGPSVYVQLGPDYIAVNRVMQGAGAAVQGWPQLPRVVQSIAKMVDQIEEALALAGSQAKA